jgi:hypothetical protein
MGRIHYLRRSDTSTRSIIGQLMRSLIELKSIIETGEAMIDESKIESDIQILCNTWEELTEYEKRSKDELTYKYNITSWSYDEYCVEVELLHLGEPLSALIDLSEGLIEYVDDDHPEIIHSLSKDVVALYDTIHEKIQSVAESLGYIYEWDDVVCNYFGEGYSLTATAYESDESCYEIEIEEEP